MEPYLHDVRKGMGLPKSRLNNKLLEWDSDKVMTKIADVI